MLFIILLVVGIVGTAILVRLDKCVGAAVLFTFAVPAGLVGSILFMILYINSFTWWDELEFQRNQLIQKGEMISQDNNEVINEWVNNVQKFNRKLFIEKNAQKRFGNTFTYHRKNNTVDFIDIDKTIEVKTIKIIH